VFGIREGKRGLILRQVLKMEGKVNLTSRNSSTAKTFDPQEPIFTIGLAAAKAGVTVPTLRMYEAEGLLIPYRTRTGRRIYSLEDLERVECIRRLIREEGLNLAGIRWLLAVLPCWKFKRCPLGDYSRCVVHTQEGKPCWMIMQQAKDREAEECRNCVVYRKALLCSHRIKGVIRELMAA